MQRQFKNINTPPSKDLSQEIAFEILSYLHGYCYWCKTFQIIPSNYKTCNECRAKRPDKIKKLKKTIKELQSKQNDADGCIIILKIIILLILLIAAKDLSVSVV